MNTALAQAYYAAEEGCIGVSTETGAGQRGTALAYAASLLGLKCVIFWVRSVYDWKPDRRALMQLYGGRVFASPSQETQVGRDLLKSNSEQAGSLGIAVSEGLEYAERNPGFAYCLGRLLNHVLIHRSVIGLETMKQFDLIDEKPDMMVGCLGGGSNFGGFILPFPLPEKWPGARENACFSLLNHHQHPIWPRESTGTILETIRGRPLSSKCTR